MKFLFNNILSVFFSKQKIFHIWIMPKKLYLCWIYHLKDKIFSMIAIGDLFTTQDIISKSILFLTLKTVAA